MRKESGDAIYIYTVTFTRRPAFYFDLPRNYHFQRRNPIRYVNRWSRSSEKWTSMRCINVGDWILSVFHIICCEHPDQINNTCNSLLFVAELFETGWMWTPKFLDLLICTKRHTVTITKIGQYVVKHKDWRIYWLFTTTNPTLEEVFTFTNITSAYANAHN